MLRVLRSGSLLLLLLVGSVGYAQSDSAAFEDLLIQALQGDMPQVLRELSAFNGTRLTPKQNAMRARFGDRFGAEHQDDAPVFADPVFAQVYALYARYWRNALMDGAALERHEARLGSGVSDLLRANGALKDGKPGSVPQDWTDRLQAFLTGRGLFAATGRTGAFLDLLVHARETEVHYPVTTPEDTLMVKVVFMDSVLCNGWEGFATFDTYYPGGWATSDALYCARSSYDLGSEQFRVSYLAHEGKHFADYKRFPKLQGPDLEYRAKLVELALADSSLPELLPFFLRNSGTDEGNPHAYANRCVMRDLSKNLFHTERMEDPHAWAALPKDQVNTAARALLLRNTQELEAAGADRVERFIH